MKLLRVVPVHQVLQTLLTINQQIFLILLLPDIIVLQELRLNFNLQLLFKLHLSINYPQFMLLSLKNIILE